MNHHELQRTIVVAFWQLAVLGAPGLTVCSFVASWKRGHRIPGCLAILSVLLVVAFMAIQIAVGSALEVLGDLAATLFSIASLWAFVVCLFKARWIVYWMLIDGFAIFAGLIGTFFLTNQ
jgi:hypothetical protein